jgi:hypothetical protein
MKISNEIISLSASAVVKTMAKKIMTIIIGVWPERRNGEMAKISAM